MNSWDGRTIGHRDGSWAPADHWTSSARDTKKILGTRGANALAGQTKKIGHRTVETSQKYGPLSTTAFEKSQDPCASASSPTPGTSLRPGAAHKNARQACVLALLTRLKNWAPDRGNVLRLVGRSSESHWRAGSRRFCVV
jgi:hypothetical protein